MILQRFCRKGVSRPPEYLIKMLLKMLRHTKHAADNSKMRRASARTAEGKP